jgi:protein TonB
VDKLSGPDELVEAATDAVKQWKYEPFVLNGTPLEVETTVELKFPN